MKGFEIGSEVAFIKDHPASNSKVGDIVRVRALRGSTCSCTTHIEVDVGKPSHFHTNDFASCDRCDRRISPPYTNWWFESFYLSPIDGLGDINELLEIVNSYFPPLLAEVIYQPEGT